MFCFVFIEYTNVFILEIRQLAFLVQLISILYAKQIMKEY